MNDTEWCKVLRTAARCVEDRQYMAAGDTLFLSRKHYTPSQYECARNLDTLVDSMKRFGSAPASEFMNKVNRILRNHGDEGLFAKVGERATRKLAIDYETHADSFGCAVADVKRDILCAAYGGKPETLTPAQLYEIMGASVTGRMSCAGPTFQQLPKSGTNHIMNKTAIELRAELAAAEARETKAAADAEKAEKLKYLASLASATGYLIATIQNGSTSPRGDIAVFRKELQPLANELGYRIVLVGDRSTAVLVQA